MPGTKKLVIVESPTKMKSIAAYLGDGYEVLSSVGHIRDLIEPKNLPPELKKGPLGKFSVDVDNGFEPYYVVSDAKKKTVSDLKRALKNADELLLATDEDREGEAIAWHLLQVLQPKVPVKRMVFHEITKDAIIAATQNTRDLDTALVDAQETRRILDRIYGYEISPVLWRKVGPGLSAGRVQSAATRLVVDRERERLAFVSAGYWDLIAQLVPGASAENGFQAKLVRLGGERIATGSDFDDTGKLKPKVVAATLDEASALALADALKVPGVPITVTKVASKPYRRSPAAPFTTSTLQQEAARKLRFTARQTMSVAQSLYENGYITYMRTDSPSLSQQAITAARKQAASLYGAETVPANPRLYKGKSKNAQEAHEAIRPSGDTFRTPSSLSSSLRGNDFKLYDLIWKRTVASQMADATGSTASVTIAAGPTGQAAHPAASEALAEFAASGTVITFRGFMLAYEESRDEERNASTDPTESKLPPLEEGQTLTLVEVEAKGHETTPAARYTEASLVKKLEELGIGRPSTYASIISTITDRGYVTPRGQALIPNWIAFSVVRLLEEFFTDLVEYDFTAEMEDDLDRIAGGTADRVDWLTSFYFGSEKHRGLRQVVDNLGEIDARSINSIHIVDDITLRIGKYGPYLEVADPTADPDATPRRVNIPPDLAPDELTPAKARELVDAPVVTDRVIGVNPDNGKEIVAKDGRFGPYVTELEPPADTDGPGESIDPLTGEVTSLADAGAPAAAPAAAAKPKRKTPAKKAAAAVKPRTASLFKSMDLATVDLDTALALLNLPRVVGLDPETQTEILAQNGKFGPYLKKGVDTRSLTSEDQIFEIDLAGAIELYAQPKYGARRASSALKDFEEPDPESGKAIKIKDGRFGAYVTDGITNATIPKAESVDEVDYERAVQLLADKRAKGPAVKKSPAKKAPAKKPAAKKPAAKKAPAKKAGAVKAGAVTKTAAKRAPVKKTGTSAATPGVRAERTPEQKAATAAKAAATRAANAAAKAAQAAAQS
ncbi:MULTISPECIES: type I DNA topoisomerase [unclassified Cryobacterium]|uniref:type I DNA topoisomerase n=1 Tax=unclassified Cryobacterium TaxID=2649013 RepID=UPI0010692984|nr:MULTISPECIES: type I DNA topoisomerase [unclassified Cryobacterium]TFC59390.1 type I DNA topoisomerase [Cryobacterium sp. TMB3-1-2]TFC67186.1 type I DNA topoisomerase [Cryobacterium sp. TMB3-15]TFC73301.1 type I DNA topoisomerase [Cryobacterium sp. TMB3-10]TFC85352.1 type I DNA topoisomerase [Cryobacterium sp. TMT4-31]TFD46189.1 type I DNA topoisomerase [Cryobacterium sp. TMB3-12]